MGLLDIAVQQVYATDRACVPKRMEYIHYQNINELQFELEYIHHYSDYIVNGQHCELKFLEAPKSFF